MYTIFSILNRKTLKLMFFGTLLVYMFFINNNMTVAQKRVDFVELDFLQPYTHNRGWLKYTDVQNSLNNYLSSQVYELLDARERGISSIGTLAEWQGRQAELARVLPGIAGPFPARNPLNARVMNTARKDGYSVENLVYESRPNFFVTASMFIPDGLRRRKAPAVIFCHGHGASGSRSPNSKIVNLVKKGFIVFTFDPVGQGERIQYPDPETGRSRFKQWDVTSEHSFPGVQALITGSSTTSYMMWDGIRAVDYLLTRSEVDTERIGITGGSGGGAQSAMISALDERIYAAAPERYMTSHRRLFETIGPQDAEQFMNHMFMHNIDYADFIAVRAPKPEIMITTTNDFFSNQGARETLAEASLIYQAYGKPENLSMVEDFGGHTSTRKNSEAIYVFFQEHLNNPGSPIEDEKLDMPTREELRVTETGNVITALGSETVFSLNKKDGILLHDRLVASRVNAEIHLSDAVASARELSGYREPSSVDDPIFSGLIPMDGYTIERYILKGEGDYPIPYLLMVPDAPNGRGIIYLHPDGKSAEAEAGGEMEWFVRKGFMVLAPDLIGLGELGPGVFRGAPFIKDVSYPLWFASMSIGRSIAGIRAGDVVRLVRTLEKRVGVEDIWAISRGELSPVLLHAAAFEPAISRLAMINPLSSYHSLLMIEDYDPSFVHGAIPFSHTAYDLPDLAASLAPRKICMINTVDGAAKIMDQAKAEEELSFARKLFTKKNAGAYLLIKTGEDIYGYLQEWIRY